MAQYLLFYNQNNKEQCRELLNCNQIINDD